GWSRSGRAKWRSLRRRGFRGRFGERGDVDLVDVVDQRAVEEVGELGVLGLQSKLRAGEGDQLVPAGLGHLPPFMAVVRLLEDRKRPLDRMHVVAKSLGRVAGRRL